MSSGRCLGRGSIRTPIVVGFTISSLLILGGATRTPGDLLFFKATKDRDIYAKSPRKYDRVALPPPWATDTVYVERIPALKIPLKEIRSVIIEKQPVLQNLDEVKRQILGAESKEKKVGGTKQRDFVYFATFVFEEQAARKLNDFAQEHNGELFDVRLGTRRVSVVTFVGPFDSNQVGLTLADKDRIRIQNIFSRIKDKVTWK